MVCQVISSLLLKTDIYIYGIHPLGSTFIYQTMPFFVVTILSFVVIRLRAFIKAKTAQLRVVVPAGAKGWKNQWQMSTYPVWVDKSPFGILTASELLGILAITLLMIYHFSRIVNIAFTRIDNNTQHHHGSGPPPAKYVLLRS